MIFTSTPVTGAYLVDIEPKQDERGFFARVSCENEFNSACINSMFKQCNMQYNTRKGTLRGMHFQCGLYAEEKLIKCTRGAIYDVIVDITPDSPTYRQWFGAELNDQNRRMMYVPKNAAHGYLALTDASEVFYLVTQFYAPEYERGVRFDDPAFGIIWPDAGPLTMSEKDRSWPMVYHSEPMLAGV